MAQKGWLELLENLSGYTTKTLSLAAGRYQIELAGGGGAIMAQTAADMLAVF